MKAQPWFVFRNWMIFMTLMMMIWGYRTDLLQIGFANSLKIPTLEGWCYHIMLLVMVVFTLLGEAMYKSLKD